jgi:hypothetical protein
MLLQVVMSRTFGNAAQTGGIGVRMLVPLIDMLNHAGDETGGLLSETATPKDNVRCVVCDCYAHDCAFP